MVVMRLHELIILKCLDRCVAYAKHWINIALITDIAFLKLIYFERGIEREGK